MLRILFLFSAGVKYENLRQLKNSSFENPDKRVSMYDLVLA